MILLKVYMPEALVVTAATGVFNNVKVAFCSGRLVATSVTVPVTVTDWAGSRLTLRIVCPRVLIFTLVKVWGMYPYRENVTE